MSNKRRRSSGSRGTASRSAAGSRTSSTGSRRSTGSGSNRRTNPERRALSASRSSRARPAPRERLAVPDDAPSAAYSLARGLLTTLSSPALVTLSFVAALLMWAALAAIGWPPMPLTMNEALSLVPVHTTVDISFLLYTGPALSGGAGPALAGFVFLVLFHTAFVTLVVSLARSAQDHEPTAEALTNAWSVLKSRFTRVLIIELGYVSVSIIIIFLLQLLGTLLFVVAVMATLYFSVFVEPAVILDEMPARDALRASMAVARMIGTKQGFLVGGYVLFVIAVFFSPGRPGVTTPTVEVWTFALAAGLLHIVALSTFVHRWRALSPALRPIAGSRNQPVRPADES